MVQRREEPRLPFEARQLIAGWRGRARENLDRDVASEAGVARTVDFAHAARADGGKDLVMPKATARRQRHCAAILHDRSETLLGRWRRSRQQRFRNAAAR